MSKKKVVEKTYDEWAKVLYEKEGIEILDPDGFIHNPQDTYTEEEFNKRLLTCTIQQHKKVEKDLNTEITEVMEKVFEEGAMEKVFTNINKLKCDYTVYKRERTACKMSVVEKCQKCGKSFKDGDELYSANIIDNGTKESCIICSKCAK